MKKTFLVGVGIAAAGLAAIGLATLPAAPTPVAKPASAAPRQNVVVELFTSQGCSSCPPADAVLARIAQLPRVIAISRPVTYWDRLGWKDTFGREANTALQQAYSRKGWTGAGVYTPQAVVQGAVGLVGAREAELRGLIAKAGRRAGPVLMIKDGAVNVSGPFAGTARLSLVALKSSAEVRIGQGENGGRTVRYTNVVIDERPIGVARPGVQARLPARDVKGADRYAVLLQQDGAGPILAARYL